ncbi:hypothetical protein AKJ51_01545 [candidate division MSBL1 archaeon SCGC-AAA382A20]|uniref:Tyr recombinase domain-containing protein n=1 Tax=candidate division MSBL1 archaeon SCGC-AAA382A20 TaxID=1698280 RepID=A0A133VLJ3_9EURY|nr:hypothetical protein AKJ51_01545 [candidate division MSBL1 archaeon SCGC-AAA382A20]
MNNKNKKTEREDYLKAKEQAKLLNAINTNCTTGLRNYCMIRLMMNAGLRASEIHNLELEDVDLTNGTAFLKNTKGGKNRYVPINLIVSDLWEWQKERMLMFKKGVPHPHDVQGEQGVKESELKNYFFITHKGKPVMTRYMRRIVKKMAVKADIYKGDSIHPHILRHTFATKFMRHKKDIYQLQKILGHESIKTTEVYLHTTIDEMKESVEGMDDDVIEELERIKTKG